MKFQRVIEFRTPGKGRRVSRRLTEDIHRLRVAMRTIRDWSPPRASAFQAFGHGSILVPPCRVSNPECISIGAGTVILEHSWLSVIRSFEDVEPRLEIGDRVHLGRFATIACVGSIVIEDDVLTADQIFLGDTFHRYDDAGRPVIAQPMARPEPVVIGAGSFLGIRATVLPGVKIGRGAYIGAGAVVTEDIPELCVAVGNPARVVRRIS